MVIGFIKLLIGVAVEKRVNIMFFLNSLPETYTKEK